MWLLAHVWGMLCAGNILNLTLHGHANSTTISSFKNSVAALVINTTLEGLTHAEDKLVNVVYAYQNVTLPLASDPIGCNYTNEVMPISTNFQVWLRPEYDIASLFMVSVYCFVTKTCARRPGAAASVERRRRERRTLLAGAAGELAGATRARQARPSRACTFSVLLLICLRFRCMLVHARADHSTDFDFCDNSVRQSFSLMQALFSLKNR
jgi:hypothetical protein